jgi:malonyl CoA-acyl carrier protein transacylase
MKPSQSVKRRRSLHVTIVSGNAETLDGLEAYLRRAGVTTNGTKHIEKMSEMTPSASSAVLLFPDDFHSELMLSALAALRLERPKILPVLVTREPQRFESLPTARGGVLPLVVPKPVWGWTILDAIRARLDCPSSETERPQ